MELRAESMSAYARRVLDERLSFRVLLRSRRVLDLENSAGRIIAVQARSVPFTPLSVCVDDDALCGLRSQEAEEGIVLSAACGRIVDCRLGAGEAKPDAWVGLFQRLLRVLARPGGFAEPADGLLWEGLDAPDAMQRAARACIEGAERLLACGDVLGATGRLAGLAGLGPGLTPAGDDFLLGAIAACMYAPDPVLRAFGLGLGEAARGCSGSRLSEAFLERVLAGEASLPLRDILRADDPKELALALGRGVAYGHTSGGDIAAGMCWMLRMQAVVCAGARAA